MDYGYLREQYPAAISKDQLYRICHISKRKALWLLEHGVIPCEDSGKQTRRFRIQLEDVIDFLERRDTGELDGVLPVGCFSSGRPSAIMVEMILEVSVDKMLAFTPLPSPSDRTMTVESSPVSTISTWSPHSCSP